MACRGRSTQSLPRVITPSPAASAAARISGRLPSSSTQVVCGCVIAFAARAVRITRSIGSLYVVMKTSTVTSVLGFVGGSPRSRSLHAPNAKSTESITLYVSARISGTAIHHECQFTEAIQRQPM